MHLKCRWLRYLMNPQKVQHCEDEAALVVVQKGIGLGSGKKRFLSILAKYLKENTFFLHTLALFNFSQRVLHAWIKNDGVALERVKNIYILVSKGTTHHFQSGNIIDREERADHSQNLEEGRYYIFAHVEPRSNERGEMFKKVNSKIRNKNQRSSSTSGGSCVNPAL